MTVEPPDVSGVTLLAVDVVGFGAPRRSDQDQVAIREGLFRLMQMALERAGIEWDRCMVEDRGDGFLLIAPGDVPTRLFTAALPRSLVDALKRVQSVPRHRDADPAAGSLRSKDSSALTWAFVL